MRNLLYSLVFLTGLFVLTLSFSQSSFAQCVDIGNTPGGGDIIECTGNDPNGITTTNNPDDVTVQPGADISRTGDPVIETLDGDDKVHINGGTITGLGPIDDGVNLGEGNNELHMTAGTIISQSEGIKALGPSNNKITIDGGLIDASTGGEEAIQLDNTPGGMNEVFINGGELRADSGVIQSNLSRDTVIVTGGRLIQVDGDDEVIATGLEEDLISVRNAFLNDPGVLEESINAGAQDDTVKIGTGAEILGTISGGDDFDTLVFEMEVPEEAFNIICSQILSQSPQNGSITINDLFYLWENFELLVCDLQPVRITRPIPTLSQWGLITIAVVLGIIGLLAVRRRKAVV